jgi:D-amino-acid oxidase
MNPTMPEKPMITVVGCGVSGLTTAIVLQRAGYSVRIVTENLPQDTTSAIAAAIWFPYQSGPVEAVNRWSRQTYFEFEILAENPASGVSMVDFLELVQAKTDAWWLDALPAGAWRLAQAGELPIGHQLGYFMKVPMVETPIYLPFLLRTFEEAGGQIHLEKISNFQSFKVKGDTIINCTGLASRELIGDSRLYPIRGQLIKVASKSDIPFISADRMPGSDDFEATYIFPRKDGIILGGTAVANDARMEWDTILGDRILARCQELVPELKGLPILSQHIGFRPGRDEIRLEREGRLIHNYGHGGAGFTVSWGCAQAVLELVESLNSH